MGSPFRADQVGSFLRPSELLEARRAGPPDPERLRAIEDRHILRVLARQQELGFDVFTDGELRRRHFMSDFTDGVEGFDHGDAMAMSWKAPSASTAPEGSVSGIVTGTLRRLRRLTAHEVPFLRDHSPGAIKMTLPSATQFPAIAYKRGVTDRVYPSHSALLWDIVTIMKAEVQALVADGVPYVQIDAPRYSYYVDPKWRDHIRTEMGLEPAAALDEAVRADNACLAGARRAGVTLAIHLCRCAAATDAATGSPKAAAIRSPRSCSARSRWTASCSSTTMSAPARSSRSGSSPGGRPWSSGSSARSDPSSS